jgi:hypothetical protein
LTEADRPAVGMPLQADRRARTPAALLEPAARGRSRYGYGSLVLEQVADAAGSTHGARIARSRTSRTWPWR